MDQLIISVYGSHNAAISMYYKNKYYVVEVERWANIKNSGLLYYNGIKNPQNVFDEICEWLLSHTDGEIVDTFIVGYADTIKPKFKYKKLVRCDHHTAHAATAFYQSPYDEMLIFTFDGGGDGAFFNVYTANKDTGISLVTTYKQDLGFPYMVLAECLSDIKREHLSTGNLVYAGKLMGLCAYGEVVDEWVPHFDEFYDKFCYDGGSYIGGSQVMQEAMQTLFNKIGIRDYEYGVSRYEGQVAWNIAATSQRAFENQFFKYADKFLEQHPELPVGLSGGCALNVLLNTKLAKRLNGKLYVPPNTNDCGISVGGILWYLKPSEQVDLTYSGLPILDAAMVTKYVDEMQLSMATNVSVKELASYISEGYIVGVIQGNAEHGSRALGNRSIICSPSGKMKDTINNKVKKREWYRPFAPVVKFSDVNKYFEFEYESRHMTYAATVREQWKKKIPAVTHEDGTGRLQTVTREQNKLLYDLVTQFEDITGFGVLLNTSFNVNGKPILSSLVDAFNLLKSSKLDAVYFNNRLYFKSAEDAPFVSIRASNGSNLFPLDPENNKPVVCLIHDGDYTIKIEKDLIELRRTYGEVLLAANADVIEKATKQVDWIKTYLLHPGKYYHRAKFIEFIDDNKLAKHLKLIWTREITDANRYKFPSVLAVDYNHTSDITKIIKTAKDLENRFYAGEAEVIAAKSIGHTGFGLFIGSCDGVIELINKAESIMISELYEKSNTILDSNLLKRALEQSTL